MRNPPPPGVARATNPIPSATRQPAPLRSLLGRIGAHKVPPSRQASCNACFPALAVFDEDGDVADRVLRFLEHGVRFGGSALVFALPEHLAVLQPRLPGPAYQWFDARATTQAVMAGRDVDLARFTELVAAPLHQAVAQGPVHVYSEMLSAVCSVGRHHEALRLERHWYDLLGEPHPHRVCGYPRRVVLTPADEAKLYDLERSTQMALDGGDL